MSLIKDIRSSEVGDKSRCSGWIWVWTVEQFSRSCSYALHLRWGKVVYSSHTCRYHTPSRSFIHTSLNRENWADHINERLEALKSIRNGGILTLPKPKTKLASTTAAATKIVVSTSRVLTNSSDQQSILKSSVDENEDNISVYTSKTMSTHETKAKNIRVKQHVWTHELI